MTTPSNHNSRLPTLAMKGTTTTTTHHHIKPHRYTDAVIIQPLSPPTPIPPFGTKRERGSDPHHGRYSDLVVQMSNLGFKTPFDVVWVVLKLFLWPTLHVRSAFTVKARDHVRHPMLISELRRVVRAGYKLGHFRNQILAWAGPTLW